MPDVEIESEHSSQSTIDELVLADDPQRWAALGFKVEGEYCQLGGVRLRLAGRGTGWDGPGTRQVVHGTGPGGRETGPSAHGAEPGGHETGRSEQGPRRGILGWSLRAIACLELDGLPTTRSESPLRDPAPIHPNGALSIDHVVSMSPALDRSVLALQAAGLDLRAIRERPTPAGAPRQAFFRLGAEILEVVQEPDEVVKRGGGPAGPAHLWGIALVVEDLERTAGMLDPHVSSIRPAVQPERRIATLRRSADVAIPVALMSANRRAHV